MCPGTERWAIWQGRQRVDGEPQAERQVCYPTSVLQVPEGGGRLADWVGCRRHWEGGKTMLQ